jgi:nicotinamidase-related amidase
MRRARKVSKDSALLVIDVQQAMFDEGVYADDALLERIGSLIARARSCNAPVIYIQHNEGPGEPLETNTPGWNVHSAIAPVDGDVVIQKRTPDSFHNTNLQDELNKLGVHRLVLTGIQTDMCVDTTCRRAFSLGYDVVLAKDAHSTFDSGHLKANEIIEHHNNVLKWFADTKESADIAF